ncbi:MAG TPA: hypothetical protein VFN35_14050 [Ktedonobacteraceae bacterium]|nr:hypothetical protein [Ktedonobacteraceae bacterium]
MAVSENQLPDGSMPGVVFRTSNGGQSWQKATLPPGLLGVSSIQFVNAQYGWVLASILQSSAGFDPRDQRQSRA